MKSMQSSYLQEIKEKSLPQILQAKNFYLTCENVVKKYDERFFRNVLLECLDTCYLHDNRENIITYLKAIKDDFSHIHIQYYSTVREEWHFLRLYTLYRYEGSDISSRSMNLKSPLSRIGHSVYFSLEKLKSTECCKGIELYSYLVDNLRRISNAIQELKGVLLMKEWEAILVYDISKVDVVFAIDHKIPVVYNGKKAIINSFVDSENVVLIYETDNGSKISEVVPVGSQFSWLDLDDLYPVKS